MGIFSWLFGKEKEEPQEELSTPTGAMCDYCHKEILQHEKRKKIAGKKLHKRCFKKMKKNVFR